MLFTLLVTAPTMRPLMRLLKISSLAPAEVAVSQRVIGLSLSSIPQEIETVGRQHQISPEIVAEVAKAYDARMAANRPELRSRMPNSPPS